MQKEQRHKHYWLLPLMKLGQPNTLTKIEGRRRGNFKQAMRTLKSMYNNPASDCRKMCLFRYWPPQSCNISTTSANISSEVPNTEKLMKARGRRRSAFIVSRCLEPLMKYEARVADITSQKKVEWRALNSANESLFFTRKYENQVLMSLSRANATLHITCLQGATNVSHLPLSFHSESHRSGCFVRVFVVTFLHH